MIRQCELICTEGISSASLEEREREREINPTLEILCMIYSCTDTDAVRFIPQNVLNSDWSEDVKY